MDKTYIESIGRQAFDWNKALDDMIALIFEEIDPQRADLLKDKASVWTTCACGNQCAIIPRLQGGKPIDRILVNLGTGFFESINVWRWIEAKSILKRIEKRSDYLIKIELAKLNQYYD